MPSSTLLHSITPPTLFSISSPRTVSISWSLSWLSLSSLWDFLPFPLHILYINTPPCLWILHFPWAYWCPLVHRWWCWGYIGWHLALIFRNGGNRWVWSGSVLSHASSPTAQSRKQSPPESSHYTWAVLGPTAEIVTLETVRWLHSQLYNQKTITALAVPCHAMLLHSIFPYSSCTDEHFSYLSLSVLFRRTLQKACSTKTAGWLREGARQCWAEGSTIFLHGQELLLLPLPVFLSFFFFWVRQCAGGRASPPLLSLLLRLLFAGDAEQQ